MKRKFTVLSLSVIMLFAFSLSAFADMGSKPRVTIKFKNRPDGIFYTDLLYQPADPERLHDNLESDYSYNDDMLQLLFSFTEDGWYPAYAGGTVIPMWGNMLPDDEGKVVYSYHGVPDNFKIIIVTENDEVKTSDIISRKTMEISLTLDYNDMTYTTKPLWQVYAGQFAITCSVTLLVELLILWLFRFGLKENIKTVVSANIFTQIVFTVLFSSAFIYGGTLGSIFAFIPLEAAVTIFELLIYRRLLKGHTEKRRMLYAIAANISTALLTWVNIDRLMDIMFEFIR